MLARLCARTGNPLFVNGRLDVALLVGAHLHLPAHAPPVATVRPHLPAGRWISAAVHTEEELARARGADLILVSPVFSPGSKPGDTRPTLGPEGFARIRAHAGCPAFALGGIGPARLPRLGPLDGVAVQSAVLAVPHPAHEAAALLGALARARASDPSPG